MDLEPSFFKKTIVAYALLPDDLQNLNASRQKAATCSNVQKSTPDEVKFIALLLTSVRCEVCDTHMQSMFSSASNSELLDRCFSTFSGVSRGRREKGL